MTRKEGMRWAAAISETNAKNAERLAKAIEADRAKRQSDLLKRYQEVTGTIDEAIDAEYDDDRIERLEERRRRVFFWTTAESHRIG